MSKFRVSCIQTNTSTNIQKNITNLEILIKKAKERKSTLVCLPECVGIMSSSKNELEEFCKNNLFLNFIYEVAKKFKIFIVVGSTVVKGGKEKFYNRSLVINPKGKQICYYNKINLFDVIISKKEKYSESNLYKAGTKVKVANLPWGKIGLTVCYDVRFPNLYKNLAKKGSIFFSIPAAFTKVTGKDHWHCLIKSRAIENGCFVFAPAQCGNHDDGRETFGHSLIVDPWGKVMAEGKNEPCVITAEINLSLVEESRKRIPAMTDYNFKY